MTEAERGETYLMELVRKRNSTVFNEYEQRFLMEVRFKTYSQLTRHERTVITRLHSWMRSNMAESPKRSEN